ncbi:hypothetical protein HETIRDRAFT_164728 [Heterobasidion irregulare TC 32-1]|uniref:Uncharacterized protein n=1 Tax=Heterobasidion irregulare (strain TC 32-1) TaxID=747525 RepID=W4JNQ4_HETIT|nr:uncharacterized protein HETIRDRAFT_164728 [Heterobasidion irregulare TC 32-1]ETW75114.1 hypothetical protein HETIRDRAFT_164728 [Heterobasidion irregulare TC 32-1]
MYTRHVSSKHFPTSKCQTRQKACSPGSHGAANEVWQLLGLATCHLCTIVRPYPS